MKTAYLSEDVTEAEEEPDTGVSIAGALQGHNSYSQKSGRVRFNNGVFLVSFSVGLTIMLTMMLMQVDDTIIHIFALLKSKD